MEKIISAMDGTIYGDTDKGNFRDSNEDAFITERLGDLMLAVVIDGVGGEDGGEVAAEIARKTIINHFESSFDTEQKIELLKEAVTKANNAIVEERRLQPEYARMSCVLTACLVDVYKMRVHMVHVGDTRLYVFKDDKLEKLSHDHSLVGYREDIGQLTEEEAMNHPERNVICRDVGSEQHGMYDEYFLESETFKFEFYPGVIFLLCSDGLSDYVTSSEIANVLRRSISIEAKVKALIDLTNEKEGQDNVTVALMEFKGEKPPLSGYEASGDDKEDQRIAYRPTRQKTWIGKIAVFLLALIAILLAGIAIEVFFTLKILSRQNHVHKISNEYAPSGEADNIPKEEVIAQ